MILINRASPANNLSIRDIDEHFRYWLEAYCSHPNREVVEKEITDYLARLDQEQFDYVFSRYGWSEILEIAERQNKLK